jgi:hypothetical protein
VCVCVCVCVVIFIKGRHVVCSFLNFFLCPPRSLRPVFPRARRCGPHSPLASETALSSATLTGAPSLSPITLAKADGPASTDLLVDHYSLDQHATFLPCLQRELPEEETRVGLRRQQDSLLASDLCASACSGSGVLLGKFCAKHTHIHAHTQTRTHTHTHRHNVHPHT